MQTKPTITLVSLLCGALLACSPASGGSGGNGGGGGSSSGGSSGGASSGGGSGSSSSGGGPINVTPLPATAFVFVKHVRQGADHIYSFDTATGQATLVTNLNDDGTKGTQLAGGIALSHDRTRVAFSGIYKADPSDAYTPGDAQAIWTVTVDGQTFTRLTPSLPMPSNDGCNVDAECASGSTCATASHHCFQTGFNVDRRDPAWSADDGTVWFGFGQFWTDQSGKLAGGSALATVSAAGGQLPMLKGLMGPCAIQSGPSPSPDGKKVAHFVGGCTIGSDQIYVDDVSLQGDGLTFPATETSPYINWAPDGSAIAYLYTDSGAETGVVVQPLPSGQPTFLVRPTDGVTRVSGLAASPDAMTIIIAVSGMGTGCDLASVTNFTGGGQPVVTALTNDGMSCYPAW